LAITVDYRLLELSQHRLHVLRMATDGDYYTVDNKNWLEIFLELIAYHTGNHVILLSRS